MTKEALTLALEALQAVQPECDDFHHNKKEMHDWSETCKPLERYNQAITAIKEALAQQSNISELKEKTANHNVDCLCADCSMLDDLEDATAQTEQEPVAWKPDRSGKYLTVVYRDLIPGDEVGEVIDHPKAVIMSWSNAVHDVQQLSNTTSPQRKPLTDEQIADIYRKASGINFYLNFARAIEAAHGIKE